MSLQFREVIVAPSADLIADTRLLEQPSNAARVDALQGLLRKRGLSFTLQPFPNVTSMVNIDIAGYGDTIMSGPTTGAGTAPLHQALAHVCAARDYACLRLAAGFTPAILRTIHTQQTPQTRSAKSLYTSCRYNEQRCKGVRPETRKR